MYNQLYFLLNLRTQYGHVQWTRSVVKLIEKLLTKSNYSSNFYLFLTWNGLYLQFTNIFVSKPSYQVHL